MARRAAHRGVAELSRIVKPGRHAAGAQLYLEVGPTGSRAWVLRYTWQGKPTWAGLGKVDTAAWGASLEDARTRAREMLDGLARGEDPLKFKRPAGKVDGPRIWVGAALEEYLAIARRAWGNPSYAAQMERRLRTYLHPLANRPVGAVTPADVAEAFRPHWHRTPSSALVTRMHVERLFDMALGVDVPNPAALRGLRAKLGPTVIEARSHPTLHYSELPGIVTRLQAIDSPVSRALQFTLLTASRTQEARDATWGEIDLEAKLWTVPRVQGRVKHRPRRANGKVLKVADHIVPLSTYALDVLAQCEPGEPGTRVFGPMGANAMWKLLTRKLDLAGKASVHGLARTCFKTWAAESAIPDDVSERALSHVNRNPYNKSDLLDMRTNVMQRWGFFLNAG